VPDAASPWARVCQLTWAPVSAEFEPESLSYLCYNFWHAADERN